MQEMLIQARIIQEMFMQEMLTQAVAYTSGKNSIVCIAILMHWILFWFKKDSNVKKKVITVRNLKDWTFLWKMLRGGLHESGRAEGGQRML